MTVANLRFRIMYLVCKLSKIMEERGLNYSSCILSFSFSQFFVMMMIE